MNMKYLAYLCFAVAILLAIFTCGVWFTFEARKQLSKQSVTTYVDKDAKCYILAGAKNDAISCVDRSYK